METEIGPGRPAKMKDVIMNLLRQYTENHPEDCEAWMSVAELAHKLKVSRDTLNYHINHYSYLLPYLEIQRINKPEKNLHIILLRIRKSAFSGKSQVLSRILKEYD